jgi:hypothetical protein
MRQAPDFAIVFKTAEKIKRLFEDQVKKSCLEAGKSNRLAGSQKQPRREEKES